MEEAASRTPPRPSMSAPTDWRKHWGKDKQVGERLTVLVRPDHCITKPAVNLHHRSWRGRRGGSRQYSQCSVLSVHCLSIDHSPLSDLVC